jgi:hypothetical protein
MGAASYRGYQMRSRNEARWACMFDLIEWPWDYETIDGEAYIADFAVVGHRPLLVEAKPDVHLRDLENHIRPVVQSVRATWKHDILLVGSTPTPAHDHDDDLNAWSSSQVIAGILIESDFSLGQAMPAPAVWGQCDECQRVGVFSMWHSYSMRPCGHYTGNWHRPWPRPAIREAWAQATNETRWRPPSADR